MVQIKSSNTMRVLLIPVVIFLVCCGCDTTNDMGRGEVALESIETVSENEIKRIAGKIEGKKILFGHMSVGDNMLDGLRMYMAPLGITTQKTEIDGQPLDKEADIIHFYIGKNTQPKDKVDDFVKLIEKKALHSPIDFAVMKFCYADFRPDTDPRVIYDYYLEAIVSLKKKYPQISFFHMTVPLTITTNTIKDRIKRLIGKEPWSDGCNRVRTAYNSILLNEVDKSMVFDIARIESTWPNGKREKTEKENHKWYSMVPLFTNDGGHLNDVGKKVVASEFIVFLDKVIER